MIDEPIAAGVDVCQHPRSSMDENAECGALEQDDLPELKQLFGNPEGITPNVRKAGNDLVDVAGMFIDVPETHIRQVRIADNGENGFHLHRDG